MAKHLTVDEIKQTVLNEMVKAMDGQGLDIGFSSENLLQMLPDGVQKGRLDLALRDLIGAGSLEINHIKDYYRLDVNVYEEYVASEDSEANGESDPWQPIKVEKHEEVAGEIEGFSAEIKAENGLRADHPEETDFVIETADATAKNLRDKEGVIIQIRLSTLIDVVKKVLEICDKSTRIGARAFALIERIMLFFS